MTISKGGKLPEATFLTMTDNGPGPVNTGDYFSGRKVVLFAIPGAFTPTCAARHIPSYVENADALKAKGVDAIACTAVNDVFVMDAQAEAAKAKGKIDFLADGNGDFAKAAGLDLDASGLGLGTRSHRYAMIVDDGVVTEIFVEPNPGEMTVSGAEEVLKAL
jgi:peroxiredoxin